MFFNKYSAGLFGFNVLIKILANERQHIMYCQNVYNKKEKSILPQNDVCICAIPTFSFTPTM